MSVTDYYKRQFAWRAWPRILDTLPGVEGLTVLDIGCGVGDLSAELAARGANVIGLDLSQEALDAARARELPRAEFHTVDLRAPFELPAPVDGVWCSFAAAYFPDLASTLENWGRHLRSGGWIALIEVDDFFGHEPLGDRARSLFAEYANEAQANGRYDFHMGRKLERQLERAGFAVTKAFTVDDRELAFDGPALSEVVAAWRTRLDGMQLLRRAFGVEFEPVRDEFLACLQRADHRSTAKVHCCIATK